MDDSLLYKMAAGMGHNQPPETIADELALRYAEDLKDKEALLIAGNTAPETITDDITQTKFAETIKKMRALEIKLEKAGDAEKKPFNDKVVAIRGFFKVHMEALEKLRLTLNKRSTEYLDRKAEEERRRAREEEDRRKAEAERLLALARAAEETKATAANAAAEARKLAQEAEEQKLAAMSEQEVASADLATARAELANTKAAMLAQAAAFAQRAKDGNPADDIEKSAMREGFEKQIAIDRAKVEHAEVALRAARQRAADAREEQHRQEEAARQAAAQARTANREVEANLTDAVRETKAADKAAAKAEWPSADLARTRSLHGAVSTLSRLWKCTVVDRDKLDKAALWPFINGEALEAALWKYMMAQAPENRVMAGAIMEIETVGQVR